MKISLLFKFGTEENMNALLKQGELYMGTFESYRKNENEEINDRNEGALSTESNGNVTFHRVDEKGNKIPMVDKKGNKIFNSAHFNDVDIQIFPDNLKRYRVYCMFSAVIDIEKITHLSSILDVDLIKSFGYDSFVVIKDAPKFYKRIDSFMSGKGLSLDCGLVKYKDLSEGYHHLTPYIKDISFQHQSEYRLCIHDVDGVEASILSVGSLEDIGEIYSIRDIDKIKLIPQE